MVAMLISAFAVTISAETTVEEDYSENLIVYYDFEPSGGGKLADKATAGNYASNLNEYGTGLSYDKGSVTIPKDAGVYLLSSYNKNDEINSANEEMTIGARLNFDSVENAKYSFFMTKAKHFALMVNKANNGTYNLKYRHETNSAAEVAFSKEFECGKDYYIFVTIELNSGTKTATAVCYWSEDGVIFNKDTEKTDLVLKSDNGIIEAGLNAAINLGTTGQKKDSDTAFEVSFDDIWIFNAAVDAASLPVIVKNRFDYADDGAAVEGTPVFRGTQTSPITGEKDENGKIKNGTYNARFVGTIDGTDNYAKVGFEVQILDYKDNASTNVKQYTTTTVYEKILGNDGGNLIEYAASDLGGKYIFALSMDGFPADGEQITVKVTPCYEAINGNGETLYGEAFEVVMQDGNIISQKKFVAAQ